MKPSKLFLKIAALVVAIGLGGALIAYRAGAFHPPAPQPQPETSETPQTVSWNDLTPEEREKIIMYGSKSAPVVGVEGPFVPAPATQPAPTQTPPQNPPTLLGGSKFKAVIGPGDLPKTTTPESPPVPPQAPTPPKP